MLNGGCRGPQYAIHLNPDQMNSFEILTREEGETSSLNALSITWRPQRDHSLEVTLCLSRHALSPEGQQLTVAGRRVLSD